MKIGFKALNANKKGGLSDLDDSFIRQDLPQPAAQKKELQTIQDGNKKAEDTIGKLFPFQHDRELALEQLTPAPDDWNFFPSPDLETVMVIAKSIYYQGQLSPGLVWEQADGSYMILAGHTRFHILNYLREHFPEEAERFGKMKCHVYSKDQITAEEAQYIIVMNNMTQRAKEAPSIQVKSIVKAMELQKAVKKEHWGELGEASHDIVARNFNIGSATVCRYYKLRKLIPTFLEKMDNNELSQRLGLMLADLSPEIQEYLLNNTDYETIGSSKWALIKKADSLEALKNILNEQVSYRYGHAVLNYAMPQGFKRLPPLAAAPEDLEAIRACLQKAVSEADCKNPQTKKLLLDLLNPENYR